MAGYIKLHRGWRDSDIFARAGPFCQRAAWVWLLENAAWKECRRRDAHGNILTVERGQLHTSTRALGEVWGWSKNKADRFLRDLEKCQMVDRKTDQHGALITICNYEKYQGEWDSLGPQNGTVSDQSRTTQEEGKEDKEEKNNTDYAFSGRVIRLTFADYRRWQNAFPDLDLRAQLTGRDAWLTERPEAERRKWFYTTPTWLANKQQEAKQQAVEKNKYGEVW